jgi:hypothetical protein
VQHVCTASHVDFPLQNSDLYQSRHFSISCDGDLCCSHPVDLQLGSLFGDRDLLDSIELLEDLSYYYSLDCVRTFVVDASVGFIGTAGYIFLYCKRGLPDSMKV